MVADVITHHNRQFLCFWIGQPFPNEIIHITVFNRLLPVIILRFCFANFINFVHENCLLAVVVFFFIDLFPQVSHFVVKSTCLSVFLILGIIRLVRHLQHYVDHFKVLFNNALFLLFLFDSCC